jgi:hypothetical protein
LGDEKSPETKRQGDTHLLLSGGRIRVPDELNGIFLSKMAEAIVVQDAWLYVVEKKTNPGRMFMELDLVLWDRRLTTDDIVTYLMPSFSRVMRLAYPGRDVHAIICTAEHTVVGEEEMPAGSDPDGAGRVRKKVKNGIHVIWPNVMVTPEKAWMLRAWFLYELYTTGIPEIPSAAMCDEWKKVIDPCVFGKNGLRMIWNRKAGTCKACKGIPFQNWMVEKRKRLRGLRGPQATAEDTVKRPNVDPCRVCNTFDNKIDEGRPYAIVAVVDCDGDPAEMMARLSSDPTHALESTSIRVVPQGAGGEVPEIAMSKRTRELIEPWHKKYISEVNRMRECDAPTGSSTKRRVVDGSCSSTLEHINPGEVAHGVFSEYVMNNMRCGVTSIKVDERKHFYLVGTNSHECMNKRGMHLRSTVYLIMMPDGYYQKCWCRKGDVYTMGGVPCSEYRSPLMPYTGLASTIASIRGLFTESFASRFPFAVGAMPSSEIPLCASSSSSSSSLPLCASHNSSLCTVGGTVTDDGRHGMMFQRSEIPERGPGLRLIDNYPELRNLDYAEVKKMVEERTRIWLADPRPDTSK